MISEILTRANIKVRTFFEQYSRLVDEQTAIIMACAEGGQPELAQPLLELKKQDQTILMEETLRHLVPREELYLLGGCPDGTYTVVEQPVSNFALDDFSNPEEHAEEENNK